MLAMLKRHWNFFEGAKFCLCPCKGGGMRQSILIRARTRVLDTCRVLFNMSLNGQVDVGKSWKTIFRVKGFGREILKICIWKDWENRFTARHEFFVNCQKAENYSMRKERRVKCTLLIKTDMNPNQWEVILGRFRFWIPNHFWCCSRKVQKCRQWGWFVEYCLSYERKDERNAPY
jgi:hypothetical protein